MAKSTFIRPIPWAEPAHPMAVEQHDYLRVLYAFIRDKYQGEIDKAFDRASRQVGFVVTTTVPISLEVDGHGRCTKIHIADDSTFRGTIFEKELMTAIGPLATLPGPLPEPIKAAEYDLYLLWNEALKLKLRTEWMEPAHVMKNWQDRLRLTTMQTTERVAQSVVWESHEPAHWFDRNIAISAKDALQISVIDEVYPELRLMDAVKVARQATFDTVPSQAKASTQLRRSDDASAVNATDVLTELASVLRRYGY